ncbi:MAG: hypothetical protein E3J41_10080 [Candidatus Cloacimonadota bacterium]|nr:MAG: hypothetical protein E3J41_10080 [Candidatus Cloacimonadota bacterium]
MAEPRLKAIERPSTYKKYADKWIAISPDENRIVGSGRTLSKAKTEAKKKGIKDPILARIPKHSGGYII